MGLGDILKRFFQNPNWNLDYNPNKSKIEKIQKIKSALQYLSVELDTDLFIPNPFNTPSSNHIYPPVLKISNNPELEEARKYATLAIDGLKDYLKYEKDIPINNKKKYQSYLEKLEETQKYLSGIKIDKPKKNILEKGSMQFYIISESFDKDIDDLVKSGAKKSKKLEDRVNLLETIILFGGLLSLLAFSTEFTGFAVSGEGSISKFSWIFPFLFLIIGLSVYIQLKNLVISGK